ncbi:hypothetical protein [Streptomyces sp. NPDC058297]|uniref:hypothetical protein n=1 Tax=unclassified Streptomyces TaxID=2593676 RepID=UPI0036EC193E
MRSLLQPVLDRTAGSPHFTRNSTGLDAASLAAEGLALLAGGTLPRKELTGVAKKLLDDGKLPKEHRQRIIENRDFARSKLHWPRKRRHGNSSAPDPRRQAPRPTTTRPSNVPVAQSLSSSQHSGIAARKVRLITKA